LALFPSTPAIPLTASVSDQIFILPADAHFFFLFFFLFRFVAQMIRDGTEGTNSGPGYVQYLNGGSSYAYTNCNLGNPYSAARAVRIIFFHPHSLTKNIIIDFNAYIYLEKLYIHIYSTTPVPARPLVTSTAPSTELPATSTTSPTDFLAGTVTVSPRVNAASLPLGALKLEMQY